MKGINGILRGIVAIACVVSSQAIFADNVPEFNPVMNRLFEGCRMLSHGVMDKNVVEVGFAADYLNQDMMIDDVPLKLVSLRTTLLDEDAVTEIKDCFRFDNIYAKLWLDTNGLGPFLEMPSLMRDITLKSECIIKDLRLKAHATAEYEIQLRGKCDFFVAYEPGTDVDVSITVPQQNVEFKQVENSTVKTAQWIMTQGGTVKLRLVNNSDIPSTILIASN